jgi:hypothetical protein
MLVSSSSIISAYFVGSVAPYDDNQALFFPLYGSFI